MSDEFEDDDDYDDEEEFDVDLEIKSTAAFAAIERKLPDIQHVYWQLGEDPLSALKRLIESRRAADMLGDPELWSGVEADIQKTLDDMARWRNETGIWFAVATRWQFENLRPENRGGIGATVEYEKCKGRHRAVIAVQKLRAKYAHEFEGFSYVEVELFPEGDDLAPSERATGANDDEPDGAA